MGDLGQEPKFITREMVDEGRKGDVPLMKTTSGTVGNVAGNVAATLPLAFVPGINSIGPAAAVGAAYGAAEPVGTKDSRLGNTAKSAALFAAIPAAQAAFSGAKSLAEPLYQGGREAIVGRTLNRFAGNDPAVIQSLKNAEQFVPGSMPTAADASGNAGLAMLEGGATPAAPEIKMAMKAQLDGNNAARVSALRDIAGDPSKMEFFKQSRSAAAEQLYQKAFSEVPDEASPWIKGQLTQLMGRPAFVDALKQGQTDAMNQGLKVSLDKPENATQILHLTKQALDDQISQAITSGANPRGLIDTRDTLVSLLESKNFSPSYREARDTFAKMSEPINQMEVGQSLYNKMVPALNDFGGTSRTRSTAFADALRNGDVTAQKATGFSGAKMADVMTPDQMASLTGVAKDLSRRAATEDAMRGVGSNTSQNLAVQNILSQAFGPLGLPQSVGQSIVKNVMATPYVGGIVKFGTQGAEEAIQNQLAAALLDPKKAAALMTSVRSSGNPRLVNSLARYLSASPGGMLGLSNSGQ